MSITSQKIAGALDAEWGLTIHDEAALWIWTNPYSANVICRKTFGVCTEEACYYVTGAAPATHTEFSAQERCAAEWGGSLAVLDAGAIAAVKAARLLSYAETKYLRTGHRKNSTGQMMGSHPAWSAGQPTGDRSMICTAVDHQLQLHEFLCKAMDAQAICQRKTGRYCMQLSAVTEKCFWVSDPVNNYDAAVSLCSEKDGVLATIDSRQERGFIINTGIASNWVWLQPRIHGDSEVDRWSDFPWSWSSWLPGQPNYHSTLQHCLLSNVNGEWNDWKCSDRTIPGLCQRVEVCKPDPEGASQVCYFVTGTSHSTDRSAQEACASQNGSLALIPASDVQLLIDSNITRSVRKISHARQYLWTGYHKNSTLELTGNPPRWRSGEPNHNTEKCIFITHLCELLDAPCDWNPIQALCQKKNAGRYCMQHDAVTEKCFWVTDPVKNYGAAANLCSEKGGLLATVDSQQEKEFIVDTTIASPYVWLSNRISAGQNWSAAITSWSGWKSDQPDNLGGNQYCLASDVNGEWDDWACTQTDLPVPGLCQLVKAACPGPEAVFIDIPTVCGSEGITEQECLDRGCCYGIVNTQPLCFVNVPSQYYVLVSHASEGRVSACPALGTGSIDSVASVDVCKAMCTHSGSDAPGSATTTSCNTINYSHSLLQCTLLTCAAENMMLETRGGDFIVLSALDVQCARPASLPPHTVVTPDVAWLTHGAVLRYTCVPGYRQLAGDAETQCRPDQTWSHHLPLQCQPVTCNLPAPAPNNTVSQTTSLFLKPGESVTYACAAGHELVSGELSRTCGEDGMVAGTPPTCAAIRCPAPANVPNTVITGTTAAAADHAVGTTLVYACRVGSRPTAGDAERTCGADKTWTGSPLVCTDIDCGQPSSVPNSAVAYDGTTYGITAKYHCLDGYKKVSGDANTTTCSDTSQWIPTVDIVCQEIQCPPPPSDFPHVHTEYAEVSVGSTVVYECEDGYEQQGAGPMVATCERSGTWTHVSVTCSPIDFGPPAEVGGAVLQYSGTVVGSAATYTCAEGRTPAEASVTITCQPWGWQTPALTCRVVTCPSSPGSVPHATVTVDAAVAVYGTSAVYRCHRGYELATANATDAVVTCSADGTWMQTNFSCREKEIEMVIEIPNGIVNADKILKIGSHVNFSCEPGYELVGNSVVSLDSNGEFDGDFPTCNEILCPTITLPVSRGLTVEFERLTVNSTIRFSCDKGYRQVAGSAALVCGADRRWSGSVAQCEKIQCSMPPAIPHGHFSGPAFGMVTARENATTPRFTPGTTVRYSCEEGWWLGGDGATEADTGTSRCLDDGTWSPAPECDKVACPPPPPPGDHMRIVMTDAYYASRAQYVCHHGYVLTSHNQTNATITCQQSGNWSEPDVTPECTLLSCGPPPRFANSTVFAESHEEGAEATYTCLPDHDHTAGDSRQRCAGDGRWHGTDMECSYVPGGVKVEIFVPADNLTEQEKADKAIGFKPVDRETINMSIGSIIGSTFIGVFLILVLVLDFVATPVNPLHTLHRNLRRVWRQFANRRRVYTVV